VSDCEGSGFWNRHASSCCASVLLPVLLTSVFLGTFTARPSVSLLFCRMPIPSATPPHRAIPTYDEVPRTSWILRYSAQATVVVSRTFFTQEVNEAFEELEEGNEDALKAEYERQVSFCSEGWPSAWKSRIRSCHGLWARHCTCVPTAKWQTPARFPYCLSAFAFAFTQSWIILDCPWPFAASPFFPAPPQVTQLAGLIEMINSDLSKLDRKKFITLCTIDVHARDVVQRLIDERVESGSAFQWQSQLRYVVSEKTKASQVG
jgi:hypothetical protein